MESIDRLKLLSSDMDLEPAEDLGCPKISTRDAQASDFPHVSQAVLPNGKRINLLKTLLTSACERNCYYCPFRAGRNFHRATFKPEEFARTFMAVHRAGIAQGIFLSSGIAGGGIRTQDKLIEVAEILRYKLGYRGYLHLKIMPGAERAQVERGMQLADRVSVNLEAPNTNRLHLLAPRKEFMEELLQPLRWVEEIRRTKPAYLGWNGRWPSSTTQFVVGGVGETDLELLATTEGLYKQLYLRRAYFSAFRPITDTPMEHLPPESPRREHRLYQASFLLRDYGFAMEELPFNASGNLPLNSDPKAAWAYVHLSNHPVEINHADQNELLRIPGIGPKSAAAIIKARRYQRFHDLSELGKLGIRASRAAPYVLLDGKRPAYQPALW
jgi:predicted DNA-binding helix-hairpin-helix protein